MLRDEDLESINRCEGRIVVGYSGGMDSHVLLHFLSQTLDRTLYACYINHGLSESADEWQAHCESVCLGLKVRFLYRKVEVDHRGSIEAAARESRYTAFENFLNQSDLLLLAHHEDDQLETVFLHLLRGDSPFGLRGMPHARTVGEARLLRPFLATPKSRIEEYARANNLNWIEDEGNRDTRFDRNYLRHTVLPIIRARWPQLSMRILKTLRRTEQGMEVIDFIAESDLANLLQGHKISLDSLAELSSLRQINVIRAWFRQSGITAIAGDRMLTVGLQNVFEAAIDAAPLFTWQGFDVQRFDDALYLLPHMQDTSGETHYVAPGFFSEPSSLHCIELVNGSITSGLQKGRGLKAESLVDLTIRFRSGGEKLKFDRTRSLKNVLQENRFPGFLRNHIPLVYSGQELVAICGISGWELPFIVVPHHQAREQESGWGLNWEF